MNILTAIKNFFFPSAQAGGLKDWSNYIPPWTSQFSVPNRLDAMDCLSESLINIVYQLTGFDASPRALAYLSKTTPAGNSESAVLNAANTYGLIPYDAWPTPDTFTWDEYYAPIPPEVMAQAVSVHIEILSPNLDVSPLWTILKFPNGAQHGVDQQNATEYFDSELGAEIKPLNYEGAVIVQQNSIKVTINTMQLVNDKGTIYLVGNLGKIGIADPATLAIFQKATNQVQQMDTSNIPEVQVLKQQSVTVNS